jgi:site-specific DNA recombinase
MRIKTIRCAVYVRKSTDKGLDRDFNSLDAQQEACAAFIASQAAEGWTLVDEKYSDGGYSGATAAADRPALEKLLGDVEAGKLDCVVVHRVDRLSRSLLDFAQIIEKLNRRGVAFVSVTQQFNTSNSMGRLTLHILLSFAQFEREMIAERTRDKIAASKRRGKWCGGHPPMGYDLDPRGGKLVVNTDEAARVLAIFNAYLEKGSLLAVVDDLRRAGLTTKSWTSRTGRTWRGAIFDKTALSRLLRNHAVAGLLEYRGEVYPGEHAAILPLETWQRVQEMLARNARSGGTEVRNKSGAMLKGTLKCAPCQSAKKPTHTTRKGRKYRYYACVRSQKLGVTMCPTRSVAAGDIEAFVVERIRGIASDPALVAETVAQARLQQRAEVAALEAERDRRAADVRDVNEEIQRLVADAGARTGDRISGKLADLQERLRSAESALTVAEEKRRAAGDAEIDEADLKAALLGFDEIWNALFPRERERIVRLLFESIEYDGATEEVHFNFRPSGIRALSGEFATTREAGAAAEGGR